MSRQGWLRDWEDRREEQEAHKERRMGPDEERDCEQAVRQLLQLGLELTHAVTRHNRRDIGILVDGARQQLQVLACSARSE